MLVRFVMVCLYVGSICVGGLVLFCVGVDREFDWFDFVLVLFRVDLIDFRPGVDIPECSICLDELGQTGTYNLHSDQLRSLILVQCKHSFHQVVSVYLKTFCFLSTLVNML